VAAPNTPMGLDSGGEPVTMMFGGGRMARDSKEGLLVVRVMLWRLASEK